ncbi:MAG: hypothetical protein N3G76_00940, partial [Candidatus Micrarchaeota archaeon]|nr:hypothetical protein [Candidatus Micrarchaeota archaeon]
MQRFGGPIFVFNVVIILALLSIFATFSNDTFTQYTKYANSTPNISVQDEVQARWSVEDTEAQQQQTAQAMAELPAGTTNWNADSLSSKESTASQSPAEQLYIEIDSLHQNVSVPDCADCKYAEIENIKAASSPDGIASHYAEPGPIDWGISDEAGTQLAASEPGYFNDTKLLQEPPAPVELAENATTNDLSKEAKAEEEVVNNKKIVSAGKVLVSADTAVYCLPDNICDVPIDIEYLGEGKGVEILIDEAKFSNQKAVSKPQLYKGKKVRDGAFEVIAKLDKKKEKSKEKEKEYDVLYLAPGEKKTIFLRVNVSEDVEWSMRFYTPEGWVTLDPTIYISGCANLNTAGATYVLTRSISGVQSDGHCININANNIILNCNGYTITSSASSPSYVWIYALNKRNITISSCTIAG